MKTKGKSQAEKKRPFRKAEKKSDVMRDAMLGRCMRRRYGGGKVR